MVTQVSWICAAPGHSGADPPLRSRGPLSSSLLLQVTLELIPHHCRALAPASPFLLLCARNWWCWSLPCSHLRLQCDLCEAASQAASASSDCCCHVVLWTSSPPEKGMAKTSKEALQKLRKEEKQKARRKGKITQLNAKFQRIVRRDKKAFLSVQCKEIEENNRIGTTRNLFKKLDRAREHFMQRWAQ